jgi:hypothetical protein
MATYFFRLETMGKTVSIRSAQYFLNYKTKEGSDEEDKIFTHVSGTW